MTFQNYLVKKTNPQHLGPECIDTVDPTGHSTKLILLVLKYSKRPSFYKI